MNTPSPELPAADVAAVRNAHDCHALYSLELPEAQLHGFIAFHRHRHPVAIGGCRCVPYPNASAARADALRLARGMGYKAAMAQVPGDGAKAVLMRPDNMDPERLFEACGAWVEQFGGRFLTGEDAGTTPVEMDLMGRTTRHVVTSAEGDPSPYTAIGVVAGIEAAVRHHLRRDALDGLAVAIQGVGKVGYHLARLLHDAGVRLVVADLNPDHTERCADEFGAAVVAVDEILLQACDVLAPCALGGVLDAATVDRIQARIVAGSANNQLASPDAGNRLFERDVLYAPDYVINAGGLIWIDEVCLRGNRREELLARRIRQIGGRLTDLFAEAASTAAPPDRVADNRAAALLDRAI